MTENKFFKSRMKDYLEVISDNNSGYIKADGNIESKSNLILGNYNLVSGSYTNLGGSIFIKKNGVSNEITRDDLLKLKNNLITDSQLTTQLSTKQDTILYDTIPIALSNKLIKSGDIYNLNYVSPSNNINWTGQHTFNSFLPTSNITPTSSYQLVNKNYVDSAISGTSNITSSNWNWTGQHTFNSLLPTSNITPTTSYQLVNKNYVDSVVSSGSSSLFSNNNTWTGLNSFLNITLNGNSLNSKLSSIETNIINNTNDISSINTSITSINSNLSSNTSTNNTQNSRLDAIETLNNLQNGRLDAIETKNINQDTSITNINSSITTINSNLSNCAKTNQINDFGTFTNTFNNIKINTISKTDAGSEIYTESPLRVNNINFWYKQGTTYYKLGDKIDEKLNISSGTASNLTINTGTFNNSSFIGSVSGLTKSNVGLSNVDNTSDLNKPVSNSTQTQLNLKLNKTSDTLQNCNIQNSTLTNCIFSGNTKLQGFGINYNFFDASSGTPNLTISSSTPHINIINSVVGGSFQVNLNQLSSNEDGMIWTVRFLLDIDWRLVCGSGVGIIDLLNDLTTNKLYQSKRCVSFIYRHSNRRYYILSEN